MPTITALTYSTQTCYTNNSSPLDGRNGHDDLFLKGVCAMLVLSRKPDEEIVISNNITIKVLEIRGRRVRLGITAPDDILILREELFSKQQDDDSAEHALFE